MANEELSDHCLRCRSEPFDESDLCEDCLDDISFGEMLRGDWGKAEQAEAIESLKGPLSVPYGQERRRLINVARYWRGEWASP